MDSNLRSSGAPVYNSLISISHLNSFNIVEKTSHQNSALKKIPKKQWVKREQDRKGALILTLILIEWRKAVLCVVNASPKARTLFFAKVTVNSGFIVIVLEFPESITMPWILARPRFSATPATLNLKEN